MWLLKTSTTSRKLYLECEYRNNYPTYWLNLMELDNWSTGTHKDFRKFIPIGYTHYQTNKEIS